MCRSALLVAVGFLTTLSLLSTSSLAWAATTWTVALAASSKGEAKSQALPAAPAPTATCSTPASARTVVVSWTAITHATSYGVYQATTSATGTYTLVATVTTATWTSGSSSRRT